MGLISRIGKAFPRPGYPVLHGSSEVGHVTSGTVGPSVGVPIAMAYVPADLAARGTELVVDCRGREFPATVVALPFYTKGSRK